MHSNCFQEVWAVRYPESFLHLPEVPPAVLVKGTSKPHVSDLLGRSKSWSLENEGRILVHGAQLSRPQEAFPPNRCYGQEAQFSGSRVFSPH